MLTRRTLFKFAATFGLGALVPRLDQSAHGAIPEARQGHDQVCDDFRSGCERSLLERNAHIGQELIWRVGYPLVPFAAKLVFA
ncbi:MAG: hypothetical protein DYH03_16040 [Nitrospira sp. NTP1]|nr:hypothetical protein [Nitrospira sp. NTP1]